MITDKEKIAIYEDILHDLHFASSVVMNSGRVAEILDAISRWSYAHRQGNGELSDQDVMLNISKATKRLAEV